MTLATDERLSAQELYHKIWALVPQVFWFQERLADWQKWEHRFDAELHTDADVLRCGTIMIESLEERFTELLAPAADDDDSDSAQACCQAEMLPCQIGYIKIHTFAGTFAGKGVAQQIYEAMQSIQDAVAFIVDLRGNLGGYVGQANKALSICMDKGATYVLKERKVDDGGYFEAFCRFDEEGYSERVEYSTKPTEHDTWNRYPNLTGSKPMIVLTNRRTASASEFFAGVLRDNGRAILLGTKTGGKGIAQNTIEVGNGFKLQITDGVFLPPSQQFFGDHGQTVNNGIVPSVVVEASDQSDVQMAAALNYLASVLSLPSPLGVG